MDYIWRKFMWLHGLHLSKVSKNEKRILMARCQMVRVFGVGSNSEPVRCNCDTYFESEKFCYCCNKYALGLMEPVVREEEADDEDSVGLSRLYDHVTRETYWTRS